MNCFSPRFNGCCTAFPGFDDEAFPANPPPSPEPHLAESEEDLLAARAEIRRQLQACRTLIVAFELTRMRKSRIGSQLWFGFWSNLYDDELAHKIAHAVSERLPVVGRLFYAAVQKLCTLTKEIEWRVASATSIDELDRLWSEMGKRALAICEQRRKCVMEIFRDLFFDFIEMPTQITEADFDDLKRAVFGLHANGNYHPGDPEAERLETENSTAGFFDYEPEVTHVREVGALFDEALSDAVAHLTIADDDDLNAQSTNPIGGIEERFLRRLDQLDGFLSAE
jgi:hypothetical protein